MARTSGSASISTDQIALATGSTFLLVYGGTKLAERLRQPSKAQSAVRKRVLTWLFEVLVRIYSVRPREINTDAIADALAEGSASSHRDSSQALPIEPSHQDERSGEHDDRQLPIEELQRLISLAQATEDHILRGLRTTSLSGSCRGGVRGR